MEVTVRPQPRERIHPQSTSSFECESSVMDSWLGIRTIGDKHLRFDNVQDSTRPTRMPAQVFVPIEVIPARSISLVDEASRRERLVRLLDQQQAWYDAAQEAAVAAEHILSLREHHQQQWLQSPLQS